MANIFSNERIQQLLRIDPQLARAKLLSNKSQFFICPFTIILGTINATNSGYKDYNIIPTDYTQFSKVFDGNESVVAQWDNSIVTDKDGNELIYDKTTDESYKTLKIGDYYNVIAELESLDIQFLPNQLNQGFISEQIVKSFDARMFNVKENIQFINDLQTNQYKFFMIPEFSTNNKDPLTWTINPEQNTDRQFFYLKNINIIRNNQKEIIYVDLSFLSVQDQFAQSGLNLNNYIQLGSPGECVSIPKIVNDTIQLDQNYLRPYPATHAQIEFFGMTAFNNVGFIGRACPASETIPNTKHRVGKPQLILPYQFYGAQNDIFNLRKSPETTYSWVYGFAWDVISSKSLKDDINQVYNPIAPRNVLGLLNTNDPTKTKSNSNNYNYWNTNFLVITKDGTEPWKTYNKGTYENILIPIVGNKYFNYTDDQKLKTTVIPTGLLDSKNENIIFSNWVHRSFSNWNMFNYFCYNTIIEMPITYTMQTPVAFSTIPVFGKLAQLFTFGLLNGFNVENVDAPTFNNMNYIMPKSIWENYTNVLWSTNPIQGFPFEVFYDAQDGQVGSLLGNTATTCSFAFNLTNSLSLANYKIANNTLTLQKDNITQSSQYINQIDPQDKTILWALSKNSQTKPFDLTKTQGFYIDVFTLNTMNKCNYQIKLFSDPVNLHKPFSNESMIFIGTYQTKSKTTKGLRQIFNLQQINNPFLKQDKPYRFPKNITQPNINVKPGEPYTIKLTDQTWTDTYNESTYWNGKNNISLITSPLYRNNKAFIYFRNSYTMAPKQLAVPAPISGYKLDSVKAGKTLWTYNYDIVVKNGDTRRSAWTARYNDQNHTPAVINNLTLYNQINGQINLLKCYNNHGLANFDYKDGGQLIYNIPHEEGDGARAYVPHGSLTKKQIDNIQVPTPNSSWKYGSIWVYDITYKNNILTYNSFQQQNYLTSESAFFTLGTNYLTTGDHSDNLNIAIESAKWTQTITIQNIVATYVPIKDDST